MTASSTECVIVLPWYSLREELRLKVFLRTNNDSTTHSERSVNVTVH